MFNSSYFLSPLYWKASSCLQFRSVNGIASSPYNSFEMMTVSKTRNFHLSETGAFFQSKSSFLTVTHVLVILCLFFFVAAVSEDFST